KVIYIGSSNNLKKRLKTYTSKTAHTNDIKNFIKDNEKIYFRINNYEKIFDCNAIQITIL
ncbi:GIY-YIG nuclease family protein, partial [Aliarcobacter butzleri]|uniref:GIY-YIG nuclease family protein n=1 Tax=Aliarcobacter butzleri TaxID=28197 RepID=UPI00263DE3BE